jgi:uncharacterized protein
MNISRSPGALYLLVTLVLTAMGVALIHHMQFGNAAYRYTVIMPGVVAVLMVLLLRKESDGSAFWSQFGVQRQTTPLLVLSLVLFSALADVSAWISHGVFNAAVPRFSFEMDVQRVSLVMLLALGEEVGWRGYALPQLALRHGWVRASLMVGIAWAFWHYPGYLVGFGAPQDIHFLVFAAWVAGASFLFTWAYLKSNGNIWTAVLMHGGANIALSSLPVMPAVAGTPATFYTLTALVVLTAFYLVFSGQLSAAGQIATQTSESPYRPTM